MEYQMEDRLCPSCSNDLNLHQGEGSLEKYCSCCGYESKETNDIFPSRQRRDSAPVISLLSKKAQKREEQKAKVKPTKDRQNYVPQRGSGRR